MFFELQDVRRRHNPTWWTNNVTGWHTAVDSTPSWNLQRGLIVGLLVAPAQQYLTHFIHHASAMLKYYEPPIGLKQWLTFIRETRNLESFSSGLKSRWQQGIFIGALSIAPQIALFRQFNSGFGSVAGGIDYPAYRKIPTTFAAMVLSSPFGVMIDMVTRAYYSDKTFPKQLQKGYKSWLDAFKRIPFEEGPYYLFKGTAPLYVKYIIGPFTAFYSYDYMQDKLSVISRSSNFPHFPIQVFSAIFGVYFGALFTYPFTHTVRQMVDFWPKKGGIDPFGGSYRKAAVWMWFHESFNNFYYGFLKKYFWHVGPQWFFTLMLAEKLGIFRYWRKDIFSGPGDNSNEDSFV